MVGAITDFVKKKQPKHVSSVKIVIFQKEMLSVFHSSMMKVQGEPVKSKGFFESFKGIKLYHTHFITPNLTFLSCSARVLGIWRGQTSHRDLGSSGGGV